MALSTGVGVRVPGGTYLVSLSSLDVPIILRDDATDMDLPLKLTRSCLEPFVP